MKTKVYKALANVAQALNKPNQYPHIIEYQTQMMDKLVKLAPSGSGFDAGSQFLSDESSDTKLVFDTAYHHMDDHGSYCGWSHHQVIIKPNLLYDIDIRVTGRNTRGIKEYIAQVFQDYLTAEYEY